MTNCRPISFEGLHQILKLPFDKFLFRRYVIQSIPPNSNIDGGSIKGSISIWNF